MKKYFLVFSIASLLIFIGCAYDEEDEGDTNPPPKVYLIPHLGDAGIDYYGNYYTTDYYGGNIILTEENNGIDAEPGTSMKIQWDGSELARAGDISCIEIYRYSDTYPADSTKRLAIIPYNADSSKFVDTFQDLPGGHPVTDSRVWEYFIIPYDNAGNSTVSDTVEYRLIGKPELEDPSDLSVFSISTADTVNFSWELDHGYQFRILFFDEGHTNLISAKDIPNCYQNCSLSESGFTPIPGYTYIWRIDAFSTGIDTTGSESEERRITFTE